MTQTTIKQRVEGIGIGLHKGEPIRIILEPMEADSGINFYRSDVGLSVKAKPENVVNTQMATVIGSQTHQISTIEHLLSAVASYGIDNLRIILDGAEVPVMDGSSISFCMMLDEAGVRKLDAQKKIMIIRKSVKVTQNEKFAQIKPSSKPKFKFNINFTHPCIGNQNYDFSFSKQNFIKEIARARTFGFVKDVQMLRSMGLALGGSLDNAVVMDDKKILNPEGLRFDDEFVRHKILDAIGDLSLLGMPVFGDYESFAGSHNLNHLLTKAILADSTNYEIVFANEVKENLYERVFA